MLSITPILRRLLQRDAVAPTRGHPWIPDEAEHCALGRRARRRAAGTRAGGAARLLRGRRRVPRGAARAAPRARGPAAEVRARLARRAISIPVLRLCCGARRPSPCSSRAVPARVSTCPSSCTGPWTRRAVHRPAALLRELGVLPSAPWRRPIAICNAGVAFVPVQLLSPALGDLLALRTRLGTTNPAHLAAHALDPGAMGAVRLAMSVPGTATGGWRTSCPRRAGRSTFLARVAPAATSRTGRASRSCRTARKRSSSRPSTATARRRRPAGARAARAVDAGRDRTPRPRAPAAGEPRRRLRARRRGRPRLHAGEGDRRAAVRPAGRVVKHQPGKFAGDSSARERRSARAGW